MNYIPFTHSKKAKAIFTLFHPSNMVWLFSVLFLLGVCLKVKVLAQPQEVSLPALEIDIIGDVHYSLYNFTDAVIPYCGLDSWAETRFTYWLNDDQTLAPYASILGSWMLYIPQAEENIPRFNWQRYIQAGFGLQWFPFEGKGTRGIRLFSLAAGRLYSNKDESQYSDYVNYDLHIGSDYYYDNFFPDEKEKKWYALIAWSNLSFRFTNFSLNDYQAVLWTGNIKFGWRKEAWGNSVLYPYAVLDWTTTIPHRDRWWENYTHAGGGIRLYPFAYKKSGMGKKLNREGIRRIHFYGEYLYYGSWLHKQPPDRVKAWDLRFGIGVSTPGIIRSKDKEPNR